MYSRLDDRHPSSCIDILAPSLTQLHHRSIIFFFGSMGLKEECWENRQIECFHTYQDLIFKSSDQDLTFIFLNERTQECTLFCFRRRKGRYRNCIANGTPFSEGGTTTSELPWRALHSGGTQRQRMHTDYSVFRQKKSHIFVILGNPRGTPSADFHCRIVAAWLDRSSSAIWDHRVTA